MARAIYGLAVLAALGISAGAVSGGFGAADGSETAAPSCAAGTSSTAAACLDHPGNEAALGLYLAGGRLSAAAKARTSRSSRRPSADRCETLPVHNAVAQQASASPQSSSRERDETTLELARRLAARFDLTITSGYRTASHNAEVGGVDGSYHTRGTRSDPGAVDMAGSKRNMRAALAWAVANVDGLAEAMVHRVCLEDDEGDPASHGGLHLHLAFSSFGDPREDGSDGDGTAAAASRRTALDRVSAAIAAASEKQAAGLLTSTQAAQAAVSATSAALEGEYGTLSAADRPVVVAIRREAQAAIEANSRRREARQQASYERYLADVDAIAARERAGELAQSDAGAMRLSRVQAALAGEYGGLSDAVRSVIEAERARLEAMLAGAAQGPQTEPEPSAPAPPG